MDDFLALFALMGKIIIKKKTDPRQAQHSSMNTVSTKPVRHHFGKVSTKEVRQDLSNGGRGWGFQEGVAATP